MLSNRRDRGAPLLPAFSNMSALAQNSTVPFLPGNTIEANFMQKNLSFPRCSTLDFVNGNIVDKLHSPPQGRQAGLKAAVQRPAWSMNGGPRAWTAPCSYSSDLSGERARKSTASYLSRPTQLPAFVAVDKVALRFICWFKDDLALLTGPDRVIIHKCILTYFLIDDSITLLEPRQENSGLNQGCLLRRQRVHNENGGFVSWRDLGVGAEIEVRGQRLHLVDCDDYTRKWYAEQNIRQAERLEIPMDPNEYRLFEDKRLRQSSTMRKQERIRQEAAFAEEVRHRFLAFDRKVLRFYAIWDDRENIFGQRHFLTLFYYLVDHSIKIVEDAKTGPPTLFLARGLVPRNFNSYHHIDQCKFDKNYISAVDFGVGIELSVFGKSFFIYDCDDYTRRYFSNELGIDLRPKINTDENTLPIPRNFTPPTNGFGTNEDSLQNCKMLRPKPPYKDMAKYKQFAGKVLRFSAKWESDRPETENRTFIMSFYPSDDTISIWETSGNARNTGLVSGKFLERMRLIKPGSTGAHVQYYERADMYVGATVMAHSRKFVLTAMDDLTARLLDHEDLGPSTAGKAAETLEALVDRLRERINPAQRAKLLEACRVADRDKKGTLSLEDFMAIFSRALYGFSDADVFTFVDAIRNGDRSLTHLPPFAVVAPMLHPCCTRVEPMLNPCCTHVAPVLHPCCTHVEPVLHPCCARVAPVLHPC